MKIIYIIIIIITLIIACQSTLPVQTAQKQLNINLFNNKNTQTVDKDILKIKNEIEQLDIRITNNNIIDLEIMNDYHNIKEQVEKLENKKDHNFIIAIEGILIAIYSTYKLISSIKNKKNKSKGDKN